MILIPRGRLPEYSPLHSPDSKSRASNLRESTPAMSNRPSAGSSMSQLTLSGSARGRIQM